MKHSNFDFVGLNVIWCFLANSSQVAIIHFKLYKDGATSATSSAYPNAPAYIVEKRKLEIKQEYYYDTFQAQKNLFKKKLGNLNEALNRNKQNIDLPSEFIYKNKAITDRVEIANSFKEYLLNIGPHLSEKIDPSVNSTTTYKSYFTEPTNSRLHFTQISELEVISAINNLENKTSYGCDGISNQCLTTGIFPTAFKIAKVKPKRAISPT